MIYSVIGEHSRPHYQHDIAAIREAHERIGKLLVELPSHCTRVMPPGYATVLDQLDALVTGLDTAIPYVGPVWLCGYQWRSEHVEPYTVWSGHEDRETAERWLEAWKGTSLGGGNNIWQVREGSCQLDKFMPRGTDPQTVMERV